MATIYNEEKNYATDNSNHTSPYTENNFDPDMLFIVRQNLNAELLWM